MALPKVLAGVLQLAANVGLLRGLGPAESGVVFVCFAVLMLCDGILGAPMDVAVVKLSTASTNGAVSAESLSVQKTAMALKWLSCVVLGVPSILLASPVSRLLFHTEEQSRTIAITVLAVVGLLTLRSIQTHFQIGRRFAIYGSADLVHSSMKFGGIALLLVLHGATPASVLWCVAAAPAVVSIAFLCFAARPLASAPISLSAARHIFGISKWYVGGAAAGTTTSRMDILLVSSLAGAPQAGIFSAAQNLTIPFQLLGQYLSVVFTPRILSLWRSGRLMRVYLYFQATTLLICLVSGTAFVLAIGHLVPRLLPATYLPGAVVAKWLVPAALAALLNFPWTVPFLMFTHPRFLFFLDAVALAVLLPLYSFAIGRHGALGAAAVTSGYAVLKTFLFQILAVHTMRNAPRVHDSDGSGFAS